MPELKFKWTVADAPSGRYRSFDKRGWPTASYVGPTDDKIAIAIHCEDSYVPANVKTGEHKELSVSIAFWPEVRNPEDGAFAWRRLKARFATLTEAKAAAIRYITLNPDVRPPEYRYELRDH